jgi:hypothetical protein
MSEVFGNAFITLVACSAAGCDEGMFSRHHAATGYSSGFLPHIVRPTIGIPDSSPDKNMKVDSMIEPRRLDTTKETQQIAAETIMQHGPDDPIFKIRMPERFRRSFSDEPINSRAWPLQERLLSPRLLICTWDHIFWHCDKSLKNESGGVVWPHGMYRYRLRDPLHRKDWEQIVENYCSRSLTKSHDKLSAVSGLAQRYQAGNSKPGKYLAGLWESHLPQHLLWVQFEYWYKAFVNKPENQRPTKYRAPSWSWASIDGLVSFIHTREAKPSDFDSTLEIVGSHVELENENSPFGRVKGGSLVLRGRFKQATTLSGHEIFATESSTGREFKLANVFLDDESQQGLKWAESRDLISCLLVTTSPDYRSLVLTGVSGRPGVYSRIGTSCSSEKEQEIWFEDASVETVTII